ncbi:transcriptional regulator [Planotetraspora thailandica]|uniref:Transcriptional regulator n=1 Tax=Planotetraspora thailandica TaxID=487172 RepID=A0A8J3XWQ8_9ACTN|nr:DUF397 domain-containing protein [Planotetraspora thailandica]GII57907.1 transcriptional regulator [Planotetraspora thailandica]
MTESRNGVHDPQLAGLVWRKSRRSNPSGNCVELAELPDGRVAIRNSRHPSGPVLVYERDDMAAFLTSAKNGAFDDFLES